MINKNYLKAGMVSSILFLLAIAPGCDHSTPASTTPTTTASLPDQEALVNEVFELAKDLKSTPANLKKIADKLKLIKSEALKQKLLAKRTGADNKATFVNLIVDAQSAPDSAEIIETVLGWNNASDQISGIKDNKNTWEILQSSTRPVEAPEDLCKVVAAVLAADLNHADELNKFVDQTDNKLNTKIVSCILAVVPEAKSDRAITQLTPANLTTLIEFLPTKLDAPTEKTTFKRVYNFSAPSRKLLRDKALAHAGDNNSLLNLTQSLKDLGDILGNDIRSGEFAILHDLGNKLKLNKDAGNVLSVAEMMGIVGPIKALYPDATSYRTAVDKTINGKTVLDIFTDVANSTVNAKLALNLDDFTAPELLAVLNEIAAMDPAASEADQAPLEFMYNAVINKDPATATALANTIAAQNFLGTLVALRATDLTAEIATDFLTKLDDQPRKDALSADVLKLLVGPRHPARYAGETSEQRFPLIRAVVHNASRDRLVDADITNATAYKLLLDAVAEKDDAQDIAKIFTIIKNEETLKVVADWSVRNPAKAQPAFKEAYDTIFDAGGKTAARDALLTAALNLPAPANTQAVKDIITQASAWGLDTAGITTDLYSYTPAGGAQLDGTLLAVLTQRAAGLNTPEAYEELRGFAQVIKPYFATPDLYYTDVTTPNKIGLKTIQRYLQDELTAHAKALRGQSHYFLATKGEYLTVLSAAIAPIADVSNADLKALYEKIAALDASYALKIGEFGVNDPTRPTFFNLLLNRGADANTQIILDHIVTALKDTPEGQNALTGQLNAARVVGPAGTPAKTPLQRLHEAPDSPIKQAMLATLYTYDDGSTAAIATPAQQASLRARVEWDFDRDTGDPVTDGQADFKKVYAQAADDVKEFMRNELLAVAYGLDATDAGRADRMNRFFEAEAWGLKDGLLDDSYSLSAPNLLPGAAAVAGPNNGRLLKALARRAIQNKLTSDDVAGAVSPNWNAPAYLELNKFSETIRDLLDDRDGYFVAEVISGDPDGTAATKAPVIVTPVIDARNPANPEAAVAATSALETLRITLDVDNMGLADYYLRVLDPAMRIAGVDNELLLTAAGQVGNTNEILEILYLEMIQETPANVVNLANLTRGAPPNTNRFIHLLAMRYADEHSVNILSDYLAQLEAGSDLATLQANLAEPGTNAAGAHLNPLQLLLQAPRVLEPAVGAEIDDPAALSRSIALIAEKVDAAFFAQVGTVRDANSNDPAVNVLLSAIAQNSLAPNLQRVVENLPASAMNTVGRWFADNYDLLLLSAPGQRDATLASVFRPAYDSRGANEQAILRQYLVGYGYSNGYGDAAGNAEIRNRAAITRVKMLVDLGLFSAADLQDPVFSVWTVAGSTQAARLAAVVFEQASQTLNALYDPAVVGEFLRSIRTKSGMNQAQWQAYLTAKDNFIVNGRSVFEYVYMYSTNPFDTDVQRRQAANTITGWFDAL